MTERGRVLVLRPEPANSRTASALEKKGFEIVGLPLTRLVKLENQERPPGPFRATVVTSANAIRMAEPELKRRIRHLPAFCVGQLTADCARQAGFNVFYTGEAGASDLFSPLRAFVRSSDRLLFIAGRVRRPELEQFACHERIVMHIVETYDTAPIEYDRRQLEERIGNRPVDYVLLYSRHALDRFQELIATVGMPGLTDRTRICCLSEAIASAAGRTMRNVRTAAGPSEEALFDLLEPEN